MSDDRFPPKTPSINTQPSPTRFTPPSVAQTPSVPTPTRVPMKIAVTVFGTPTYFSVEAAVAEFQNYVQAQTRFDLQIATNKYPPLALDEYHLIPESGNCTFVDPWFVHSETLAKLPRNVKVQIVLYDIQSTTTCWGGRCYSPSPQTRNVPLIAIPFGDSIKWWPVEPNWKIRTATALVHEFYHALSQLLEAKGHKPPDPDKANQYGYNDKNDPGWIRFDKFIYGQITDAMYKDLAPTVQESQEIIDEICKLYKQWLTNASSLTPGEFEEAKQTMNRRLKLIDSEVDILVAQKKFSLKQNY